MTQNLTRTSDQNFGLSNETLLELDNSNKSVMKEVLEPQLPIDSIRIRQSYTIETNADYKMSFGQRVLAVYDRTLDRIDDVRERTCRLFGRIGMAVLEDVGGLFYSARRLERNFWRNQTLL
jgi:hypothetical protein